MYLDAHRYKMGSPHEITSIVLSAVFSLSSSEIFYKYSDERFLGNPPKEVPYFDVGIAKYILVVKHQVFLA